MPRFIFLQGKKFWSMSLFQLLSCKASLKLCGSPNSARNPNLPLYLIVPSVYVLGLVMP
jgi:hypothetical protein